MITCPWLHSHYPEAISWFYRPDYGVGYVFVANVFTTLITLLLLIPDILPGIRAKVDGTVLKQILRYSFPILILGIAGIFNQTADKILFPFLFDDKEYANEQLGIYGACFKIAVVMVMFMIVVMMVMFVMMLILSMVMMMRSVVMTALRADNLRKEFLLH